MNTASIIIIIVLAAIAAASIALNVGQHKQQQYTQGEINRFIKSAAELELELKRVKNELANEINHREWAVGRIKDQANLVKGLQSALKVASKDKWKQWQQQQEDKRDN